MTLKQYRQVEEAGKGAARATTQVGQVAKIEQQEGRTTADARTSSRAPVSKPTGKPQGKLVPVTSAEMLQVQTSPQHCLHWCGVNSTLSAIHELDGLPELHSAENQSRNT